MTEPFALGLSWIPKGRFRMGDLSGSGQADEHPVREVEIGAFWMMRTEVTRDMFDRFVTAAGHETGDRCWVFDRGWTERDGLDWRNPGFEQSGDHPLTRVNSCDAQAFIRWLKRSIGEAFRLPSEAEWEYAARAGTETIYYTGDEPAALCTNANAADQSALEHYPGFAVNFCDDGYVRTAPVASFAVNPWGL